MKMIIAIVKDNDTDAVTNALTSATFLVTTIASTGGFLRSGFSTMLCGVEDEQLSLAMDAIRGVFLPQKTDGERHCTLFVINVAEYHHF